MTYLAAALLVALAAQQWWHSRERQALLDRIQAPERVIERRLVPDAEMVDAVNPEDDQDYWDARGVKVPDNDPEVNEWHD